MENGHELKMGNKCTYLEEKLKGQSSPNTNIKDFFC